MDINQALKDALEIAHRLQDEDSNSPLSDADDLASHVIEIDDFLNKGGFLPERWQVKSA